MAKNPLPSYNWFASDWLGSRAHAVMTLEQQGAYRNLLDHAWESDPPCSLPDDDAELAQLSGAGKRWSAMAAKVRLWFSARDGRLWNERMAKGFERALQLHEARKLGGKHSRGKPGQELRDNLSTLRAELEHTRSLAQALLKVPTPTPTSTKEKEGDTSPAAHPAKAGLTPLERYTGKDLADWWNEIVAYNGTFARVTLPLSGDRRKKADTRVRELVAKEVDPVDYYQGVLNKLRGTAFCRGENDRGWRADFDWLIKNESSAQRILEGKYANQKAGTNGGGRQGNLSGHQNSLRA